MPTSCDHRKNRYKRSTGTQAVESSEVTGLIQERSPSVIQLGKSYGWHRVIEPSQSCDANAWPCDGNDPCPARLADGLPIKVGLVLDQVVHQNFVILLLLSSQRCPLEIVCPFEDGRDGRDGPRSSHHLSKLGFAKRWRWDGLCGVENIKRCSS